MKLAEAFSKRTYGRTHNFADGADNEYGHGTIVQEAYDTVPIHPYWGGPPTPDNTEINPYFTTDFYQALSGAGGGGGMGGSISGGDGGGGGAGIGIEAEEEMDDDFSIEDNGKDFSFTDFLGSGCGGGGGEAHEGEQKLRGGWKLYRINNEESYGEE